MFTESKKKHERRNFSSFGDWIAHASSSKPNLFKTVSRSTTGGVELVVTRQEVAFSDEANSDFVFQLCCEGHVTIEHFDLGFGRCSCTDSAGRWLAAPASTVTELDGHGSFTVAAVCVPWFRVGEDISRLAGREVQHFGRVHERCDNDDPFVTLALRNILQNHRESEIYADCMLAMIFFRLMQLSGISNLPPEETRKLSPRQLSRTIEFLHSNAIASTFCLDDLAAIADQSRFHFLRSFKASTGLTPHEYLMRLRLELAKHRLLAGQAIASAALGCGFYDQSHFTRHFNRCYGVTPGRYVREAAR